MTRLLVRATPPAAGAALADLVARLLADLPELVLALPTGGTPIPFYASLAARHRAGGADFSRATTFNLDEFCGLDPEASGSFRAFMHQHFFDRVNLAPARRHVLDGRARDWRAEAASFERRIDAAGGLDLAIVGIGTNGHIAFNEPAAQLPARTHRVRLSAATRRANAYLFGGDARRVPAYALTMGMATILNARAICLLATGAHKARVVAQALGGPITPRVPASLLQLHPNVTAVLDRDAASRVSVRPAGRRRR